MSLATQQTQERAEPDCAHCGLPVPKALRQAGDALSFCCAACEVVYGAIHDAGLDHYYEVKKQAAVSRPAEAAQSNYQYLDDPSFQAGFVRGHDNGTAEVSLFLEGVHCGACLWLIERLPQVLPGMIESRLNMGTQVVRIRWRPEVVRLSQIAATIGDFGYAPHPYRSQNADRLRREEQRKVLIRLGVAGACAGNCMLIAFALYGGQLSGMDSLIESVLRWVSLGFALVALAGPGRVFFVGAWAALRTGVAHMDLPVAIALTAGVGWGAWNTVQGTGEVYFESLTAVVFLLLVGRWIQQRYQRAAQERVAAQFCLTPSSAHRVDQQTGGATEVPLEALRVGDSVAVQPGQIVPVDGRITAGNSELDRSLLTGESEPIRCGVGDWIEAGTTNMSAELRIHCERTGDQTRVARLMEQVEQSAADRAPVVQLANRVARWFTVIVLTLAAGTLLAWWSRGAEAAMEHTIALLIVTCPCALGLATPLALMAAIGQAARRGILIKGGDVLELLSKPGQLWVDKTGTLTEGQLKLVQWQGDAQWGHYAAALERELQHPVAKAIVSAFEEEEPEPAQRLAVSHVEVTNGAGVTGVVNGSKLALGSPSWVEQHHVSSIPDWVRVSTDRCLSRALSPVWLAVDGQIEAVGALGDQIRPEAAGLIKELKRRGWKTGILSGDRKEVVAAVAKQVGVPSDVLGAEMSPERKAAVVSESVQAQEVALRPRDRGPIVMVGDGINDTAAFAAANVGVAVHGGAAASLKSADVFLRRDGLAPLLELVDGAKRLRWVLKRNIAASLGYNVVAATLAITGKIDPIVAAILMPLSSLTVLTLSLRARSFAKRGEAQ